MHRTVLCVILTAWLWPSLGFSGDGLRVGPCPMSCRTLGIDKRHCKDWREGNTCYVEDTRFSNTSSNRPRPTPLPTIAPIRPPTGINPQKPSYSGAGYEECRRLSRFDIGRPYINIARVRPTGNVFGSKYKVFGSVEGMCLVEAGYFESGRKMSDIPVIPTRDFRRFEFEVTIRGDEFPELRAYTINGDREVRPLDRRDLDGDPRDRYDDRYSSPNDRPYDRPPYDRPYDRPYGRSGPSQAPDSGPGTFLNDLLLGGNGRR